MLRKAQFSKTEPEINRIYEPPNYKLQFKVMIHKFLIDKSPGPGGFTSEYITHQKMSNAYPSEILFKKIVEGRTLPSSFSETLSP